MGIHVLPGHYIQRRQGAVTDRTRGQFELRLLRCLELESQRPSVLLSSGNARLVHESDGTLCVIHGNGELRTTQPVDLTVWSSLSFRWDTTRDVAASRVMLALDTVGLTLVPTLGVGWPTQFGVIGDFNVPGGLVCCGARPGYTFDAFYGFFDRVFFRDGVVDDDIGKNTSELLFKSAKTLLHDSLGNNHWAAAGAPLWVEETL